MRLEPKPAATTERLRDKGRPCVPCPLHGARTSCGDEARVLGPRAQACFKAFHAEHSRHAHGLHSVLAGCLGTPRLLRHF